MMVFDLPPRPTAEEKAERARLQAIEGAAARADYAAALAHEYEKTERLRAIRLERDRLAGEQRAAASKPSAAAKPRRTKSAPAR